MCYIFNQINTLSNKCNDTKKSGKMEMMFSLQKSMLSICDVD